MVNYKLYGIVEFRGKSVRSISPGLFARLMKLPDSARADLLEFLGETPVADAQLASMLDSMAVRTLGERRQFTLETR
jgi:hypothetical protein